MKKLKTESRKLKSTESESISAFRFPLSNFPA